ncbi:hypothetical protein GPJ56_004292 [Histomonas meleagridis]|uniref:uncharacterized protein n=1 Tax=Histomonas meleagridis TaxID=135588 RepID=UPI0035595DEC|nr:hypothetical protein GPJ56_004292 [Histomonas meleagridis]KAH0800493.1 hypothetical protein GO595_006696 [Histomonas meleagridis]
MNPIQERIYHTLNEILERIEDLEYRTSCIDKRIHMLSRDIEQDRKDRLFSAFEASIEAKRNSHARSSPPPPPTKTKTTVTKQQNLLTSKSASSSSNNKDESAKPQLEPKATKVLPKEETPKSSTKVQPSPQKKSITIKEPDESSTGDESDSQDKDFDTDDDILFGDVQSDLQFDE